MLLAQFLPDAARDVLIAPIAFCFLGALLFGFGTTRGRKRISALQIVGYALAGMALFFGARWLWNMWEPQTGFIYRSSLQGRQRLMVAHYLAVIIPLITLGTLAFLTHRFRNAFSDND